MFKSRKSGYTVIKEAMTMQIKMVPARGVRRVDFHGNAKEGVWIELVDLDGVTRHSQPLDDEEVAQLTNVLTREDSGRAV